MIGKVHTVARVAMFGSVIDRIGQVTGPAASWTGKPGATPVERYFGFAHMEDNEWSVERKNWAALDLPQFGDIVNADGLAAPFGGSHMLTTGIAYDHSDRLAAHNAVVQPANATAFGAVWMYMLVPS